MPSGSRGGAALGSWAPARAPQARSRLHPRKRQSRADLKRLIRLAWPFFTIYLSRRKPLPPLYTPAENVRFFAVLFRFPAPPGRSTGKRYWLRRSDEPTNLPRQGIAGTGRDVTRVDPGCLSPTSR